MGNDRRGIDCQGTVDASDGVVGLVRHRHGVGIGAHVGARGARGADAHQARHSITAQKSSNGKARDRLGSTVVSGIQAVGSGHQGRTRDFTVSARESVHPIRQEIVTSIGRAQANASDGISQICAYYGLAKGASATDVDTVIGDFPRHAHHHIGHRRGGIIYLAQTRCVGGNFFGGDGQSTHKNGGAQEIISRLYVSQIFDVVVAHHCIARST